MNNKKKTARYGFMISFDWFGDLKFQLEGKNPRDLQKYFGKPNRVEGNMWIYTGLKIQSNDEKIRPVLRVSLSGGLIALINVANK